MSKNIPSFRVTIVGETAAELRANIFEFLGLDKEPVPEPAEEQGDFLTQAAARPTSRTATETLRIRAEQFTTPNLPSIPVAQPASVSAMPSLSPIGANEFGFDTKGLPWDERIHSATQAKTKDGSWRYKRGVEDSYINQVENELRQRAGAAPIAQMAAPPIPHPVAPPVAAPALTIAQPPVALPPNTPPGFASAPVAPVSAPAVAPPPPFPVPAALPSAHTVETFKAHMVKIMSDLINERKLNQDYLNQLKAYFKVEQIWNVNEQQAAELFENFVAHGLIVKA